MTLTSGTGPAGPQFSLSEYEHIRALCIANANAANAPIRAKVDAWLASRAFHTAQTGGFKDDTLDQWTPTPDRASPSPASTATARGDSSGTHGSPPSSPGIASPLGHSPAPTVSVPSSSSPTTAT